VSSRLNERPGIRSPKADLRGPKADVRGPKGDISSPRGVGGEPASPARRSPAAIAEALDQVDREIRALRIEFEKFFNGALHVPPEEMRTRVQVQIRNLRNMNITSSVEAFRLGDLESRFNSYNELFNRRLRDQEEGRKAGVRAAAPPPAERRFDPEKGVVVGTQMEAAAVEALYEGLAKNPGDGPRFDLESFRTYLGKQVAAIQQKTGCAEVQFRIASEDGKLKLKARAL
jgi:hypothetical protein